MFLGPYYFGKRSPGLLGSNFMMVVCIWTSGSLCARRIIGVGACGDYGFISVESYGVYRVQHLESTPNPQP